jgi:hypothetical protein
VERVPVERAGVQPFAGRRLDELQRLPHAEARLGDLGGRAPADERGQALLVRNKRRGEDRDVAAREDVRRATHRVDSDDLVRIELAPHSCVERNHGPARRMLLEPARRDRGQRLGPFVQMVAGDAERERLPVVDVEGSARHGPSAR